MRSAFDHCHAGLGEGGTVSVAANREGARIGINVSKNRTGSAFTTPPSMILLAASSVASISPSLRQSWPTKVGLLWRHAPLRDRVTVGGMAEPVVQFESAFGRLLRECSSAAPRK